MKVYNNCAMFVNNSYSTVPPGTVRKFQVVNEAIQSSISSAFISNFNLFVRMPFQYSNDNTSTFNRLFQGRNPIPHCQFRPVSA